MVKRKKRKQSGRSRADGEAQPICRLEVGCTTDELRDLVRCRGRAIKEGKSIPLLCSVDGFLRDRRELWQIPEVIELSRRVIESGLISLMWPNIGDERQEEVWGAADFWACASGHFVPAPCGGVIVMVPEMLDEFQRTLEQSNGICEGLFADLSGRRESTPPAPTAEATARRGELYATACCEIPKVIAQARSKGYGPEDIVVVVTDRTDQDAHTLTLQQLMGSDAAMFVPLDMLAVHVSAMLRGPFLELIGRLQPNLVRRVANESREATEVWVVVWGYGGAQLMKMREPIPRDLS